MPDMVRDFAGLPAATPVAFTVTVMVSPDEAAVPPTSPDTVCVPVNV